MNSRKLLVIDDERELAELVKKRFEANGYEVVTAFDGAAGLQKVSSEKPDLVILDIMMPKIDGWEVLRRLRSNKATRSLPVIMLTAKGETDDILKAQRDQATDYFIKPFESQELL